MSFLSLAVRNQLGRFLAISSVALVLLTTLACDELVGTCCCLTADKGASVQNRKACTDGGGICTNNNVCSQSPSPTSSLSSPSHRFSLDKSFLPGLPSEFTTQAQVAEPSQVSGSQRKGLGDPAACDNECAANGAFCLKVNLSDDNGLVPKVEQARKLIMDKTHERIATKQFMDIFNTTTDPCARKDTLLTPSLIKNSGQSCVLNSSINNQKGSFDFTIHLPSKLEGNRNLQNDTITLLFPDEATYPKLTIGDVALNRDFGGRVERAIATNESGIVSTDRGCIAVRMLPSNVH